MSKTAYQNPQTTAITPHTEFPMVQIGRQQFMMVPPADYQQLKSNRLGWLILSCSGGVFALAAAVALAANALKPVAAPPTPEPVVVEKPVVVDRFCVIFCGK